jgi:UDP-N-acetylmuramoyl-L-alanyl-D-glutamate--2,6-diaminopimelate ligase
VRLRALLADDARLLGGDDVEVQGLALDSRMLRPGDLFAALPGTRTDGRAFIEDALARGAVAVLGGPDLAAAGLAVPVAVAAEPRRALAAMAARFYAAQPEATVAVTGTNGKSSIVSFARQLWTGLGRAAASIGTLGVVAPGLERPLGLTTPDPIELHAILAELAGRGVTVAAIEASSHALAQHRIDGVKLAAAAFSNLTRDHFDYHGGHEAYLAAKARLFAELLPAGATAVLNSDTPEFKALTAVCRERAIEVLDYGRQARCLRLVQQAWRPAGQALRVEILGCKGEVESPLVGGFQAHNLLAAAGLVVATGADPARVIAGLGRVEGARGRMQLVARHPSGAPIFVDYAHTPDALERVLDALRPHTRGALAVVFGAGGDRDPGKRPLMGLAAAGRAERIYVTDDNPRSEDPAAIRRAVLAGCPAAIDAGDRHSAICRAVAELDRGDLLVIAGKGHELGQTIAGRTEPFDDAAVVAEAVARLAAVPV